MRARHSVPLDMVSAQFAAVTDDLPIRAVKVGTTWSVGLVDLLGGLLRDMGVPVVVDPVMVTAAGGWLSSDAAAIREAVIDRLLPVAAVVTPNLREAELLAGVRRGQADQRRLAELLVGLGANAVLVSPDGDGGEDWFFDGDRHVPLSTVRHRTTADHGAGCAHSSLVAGLLAQGFPLIHAVAEAQRRVGAGVSAGLVHLGRGAQPIDVLDLAARGAAAGR